MMTLTVYDRGRPALSSSTLVNITVTDVNDCEPQFTNSSYEATVSENAVVGQTVLTLRAVDADIGLNGQLEYLLGYLRNSGIYKALPLKYKL